MSAAAQRLTFEAEIVSVPREAFEHVGFRRWIASEDFPESARATFAERELFLDMSPESIEAHNKTKGAVTAALEWIVREEDLGEIYPGGALLTNEAAGLSTEPDVMFATWRTLETGRLQLAPRSDGNLDGIELVGAPDVVVEVVSTSSARKDTVALRAAYARAGITEYWIIDARDQALRFEILSLSGDGVYLPPVSSEVPQQSSVFARAFRLERKRNRVGRWTYRLQSSP